MSGRLHDAATGHAHLSKLLLPAPAAGPPSQRTAAIGSEASTLTTRCAGLSCPAILQELRSLTFRYMYMDEWNELAGKVTSARFIKPWQQVWVGCPQLTYVKLEK